MVKIPTWGGEDSKNLRAYIKKIYKIHPLTEFFHPPTESFLIRSNAGETAVHDLVGIEYAVKMVGLVLENYIYLKYTAEAAVTAAVSVLRREAPRCIGR